MDSVFLLEDEARTDFLRTIGEALGCTYICLWSSLPPLQNDLFSIDGWFNIENDQPSSSSGSISQRLFDEYRRSPCSIEYGCVPGLAFKEGMDFLELHDQELLKYVSTETQRQFYQEARIKTAIFMGCQSGEIEIGMANLTNINMEVEIRNLLKEDFLQQYRLRESTIMDPSQHSFLPDPLVGTSDEQVNVTAPTTIPPHQQPIQAYNLLQNIQLPIPENVVDAAMTRAILTILSSQPFLPSNQTQQIQTSQKITDGRGAFKPYDLDLVPRVESRLIFPGQYKMKLIFAMLRSIYLTRRKGEKEESSPTSHQFHHKLSERMRRKKIKEGIQALRSLLPVECKKDQVSVLSSVLEYLNALKAQIQELQEKNQSLETRLSSEKEVTKEAESTTERVVVSVIAADESSSEDQQIELRVTVNKNDCDVMKLVSQLLKCLEQMKSVTLTSMEASTQSLQTNQFNQVIFRLKIKTSDWDEQSFKETMTRAVEDLTK